MTDEAEIRAGIDDRVRAVREKDLEGLLAAYAPDVATFDVVAPLARAGLGAVRERVTAWFSSFVTPIDYEVRDVRLFVSGAVAFEHHFTRVRGTNKAGAKIDMWFRETVGYQKLDGRWKVIHQHSSVPFDATSGAALLSLQP